MQKYILKCSKDMDVRIYDGGGGAGGRMSS